MTGLCIILIDAVVARQETQEKGHLVVSRTSRPVPQNKDTEESFVVQKTSVLFQYQYVDIAIYTTIVNRE